MEDNQKRNNNRILHKKILNKTYLKEINQFN